jgi:hypothetical protein
VSVFVFEIKRGERKNVLLAQVNTPKSHHHTIEIIPQRRMQKTRLKKQTYLLLEQMETGLFIFLSLKVAPFSFSLLF